MTNERRDTPRIPVTLEAILNYNNRDYRHLLTRDISLDGVSVHAPVDLRLKKEPIDIAIGLPGNPDKHFHRFRARLVHATRQGAGFTFEAVEPEAYEALLDLVFADRPSGIR
jgi:c-di-GMP-binding flagellar brake protein YcgR